MNQTIVLAAAISLSACSAGESPAPDHPEVTVDAPALIGKSRAEVDAVLGTAQCHEETAGTSCEYGEYESAFFVDGKAANLTLPAASDLRVYGLELGEPSEAGDSFERWQTQINGTPAEVSRFSDFVYIMTHEA